MIRSVSIAIVVVLSWRSQAMAARIVIDDFSVGALRFDVPSDASYPSVIQTALDVNSVIGGTRTTIFFDSRTFGAAVITINNSLDGLFIFDGTNDRSLAEGAYLQYGNSNLLVVKPPSNPLNLDLREVSSGALQIAFRYYIVPNDLRPPGLGVQLFTDGTLGARSSIRFPSTSEPFVVSIPLSRFESLNAADIDGVNVIFDGRPGARFAVDSILIVPEPEPLALTALSVVLLSPSRRLQRLFFDGERK